MRKRKCSPAGRRRRLVDFRQNVTARQLFLSEYFIVHRLLEVYKYLLKVHVVTAFEKSLANMTQRLQKLATASEQKVGDVAAELQEISLLSLSLTVERRHCLF
jgi:steroid 5-alpha reductase family enzyme